jgi:aspartyl-tRNA(Asn)/glutamyl-tRNA(Gln) amidotransferase subunit C
VEAQHKPADSDSPVGDPAAVERALHLARLGVEPGEREPFAREFERVLASFAELRRIDVSGVAPLHTPSERVDALREDRRAPSLERDRLLANAPDARDGFFGVPKTIGGEA